MAAPFRIFIGGSELKQWTDATLTRSKDDLTGTLNVNVFFSYLPTGPVMTSAAAGKPVQVYIGGQLAFNGIVDKRRGTGAKNGEEGTKESAPSELSREVEIGPDEYTVSISARGKTKILIDSSQRHPTGTILKTNNREVVDKLLEGTDIQLEWMSETIDIDKVRFRDGARVIDELRRVATEYSHFIYETRDGKLRVTDDTARVTGDPLVLGQNILRFSASQGEDVSRSEIKVKGQRTAFDEWGEDALLETFEVFSDGASTNKAPVIIQHYGDATKETLKRRAEFEANKRTSASKDVKVEVFHVQASGAPWDVGNLHYVEVPPEGLFDVLECTNITYSVDATKTIKTALTLAPVPTRGVSGFSGNFSSIISLAAEELSSLGKMRKAERGITTPEGDYPGSWGGAQISIPDPLKSVFNIGTKVIGALLTEAAVPLVLPSFLEGDDDDV